MNNVRFASAGAFAVLAVMAFACEHNQSSAVPGTAPPQGVTNQQDMATGRIVDKLTTARCDHEQTCNNIGNGRTYATRDVCVDKVKGDMANQLNAYNCPRGIDENRLDSCVASLRSGDCGVSLDMLSRARDCNSRSLCMK